MMRNQMPNAYGWIMTVAILALILFLMAIILFPQPAIATVARIEESPGQVLYRSQHRLQDQSGKTWQVIVFKQIQPGQAASLQLRLVGLPGAAEVVHPQPLMIQPKQGGVLTATDVFLEEAPLPTIGQYNVGNLISELPTEDLRLKIPLVGHQFVELQVPRSIVQEWQTVATQS
ncbi:MAG: DUF3122 domain-containing protein [Elainellaceae cyanobacterium]